MLFERACRVIPGGVCHNLRYFPPYPFFVSRAEGSRIWDEDGNAYIDYWMGHYAHILGHRHPEVVKAVSRCIGEEFYHPGLVNRYEVELAELVVELVPSAQKVKFCSSGTEAAMYAVRLARAYTNRKIVLKIRGGWHGASTDLSCGISHPFEVSETDGLPSGVEENCIPIPFNDWDAAKSVIEKYAEDIACAIVEPVVGVGGFIPARKDYLENLKKRLHEIGAILIFDEVITGFRIGPGGYQERCGVIPDLTVLGKVLGGGFPVGAVAGRSDIMELSSHSRKKPDRVLMGGGTFSCNPVSMVAGITVLRILKENPGIYRELEEKAQKLRRWIEEAAKGRLFVKTTGAGSLFMVHIMKEEKQIESPDDLFRYTHWELRDTIIRRRLAELGVHMIHAGGSLSTAHGEEDMVRTAEAFEKLFSELKL